MEKLIKYYGSNKPKILFLTNTNIPSKWFDYLQIPSEDLGVLYIKHKTWTDDIDKQVYEYIIQFKPEIIVPVGKLCNEYFIPGVKMKLVAGKIYYPDPKFKQYDICHLIGAAYFNHYGNEYKQLESFKYHLIMKYKYGTK